MAVDFKKTVADKKTKLSGKSLDGPSGQLESPLVDSYLEGNLYKIPIEEIAGDPNQPRKTFDENTLVELAVSIEKQGVLQPIIIRTNDNKDIESDFLIVAGERRFRASKIAGLKIIPALFTKGDPEEIALIENLQRDDLKPIEEAEAYQKVIESHSYTHEKLSDVVGKARSTITELLTLTKLPDTVKEECRTSNTPKNVLLEIAKQKDPAAMAALFEKVKNEQLTVSKIRQMTRPRSPRIVRQLDQRVLHNIVESKRLIYKMNEAEISPELKAQLRQEVEDFYSMAIEIFSK